MRKFSILMLILLGILSIAGPVLACEPDYYYDCDDLGSNYKFGFKIAGAKNGTYHLTTSYGKFVGGAPQDKEHYVQISDSRSQSFDWKSSFGVDAVIVSHNGKSYAKTMSEKKEWNNFPGNKYTSVLFCYDYSLSVSATAQGTSTTAAAWDITKSVDVLEQSKFAGETANFLYTVAVDRTAGSETGTQVSTEVKVKNDTPISATIKEIRDMLTPWNKDVKLDCGNIKFPYKMSPRSELTCTAATAVDARRDGEYKVEVRTYGYVGGASTSAKTQWSGDPNVTGGPSTVTVTDTNAAFGGPYSITNDQSWTYPVSLTCPTDPTVYVNGVYTTTLGNTAQITETAQQASQSVKLTCYAPVATVSNTMAYDATYSWAISKTSPIDKLILQMNQIGAVDYYVNISVANRIESNFQLAGIITLSNPNPAAPMEVTVADEITPGTPAVLTGCTNPVTIPAGGSVTCQYTGTYADKLQGSNSLLVTFNSINFNTVTPYDYTNAVVNEIDECVTITDDALTEPLGVVCANQAPVTYDYGLLMGPYTECGLTAYPNTANYTTNDTGTTDYSNWQVMIKVKCDVLTNCTYTPAYWSTHADTNDLATYNDAWDAVGGPNAQFLNTGSTWLEVLTSDASSSTYLQLAQGYIAGRLNVAYGAEASTQFLSTLDHAEAMLTEYGTAQGSIIPGSPTADDFILTSRNINDYNNGLTGPGLCPDCNQ